MRLYFRVIGWQILAKVFPSHKIFKLYDDFLNSPAYLAEQMKNDDMDLLSLSMSSMGKVPQYHILGLNQGKILNGEVSVKTEPMLDEE